jgi:hypothetical protein
MPGGQPAWQADGEQDDWAGAGESLEPLPSAQTRHGVTDDRSRRRWPAPDADESDEGNAW